MIIPEKQSERKSEKQPKQQLKRQFADTFLYNKDDNKDEDNKEYNNKDDIRDKEYTRNENDKRDKNISRKIKHNSKPKEQIIIAVDMVKGLFRQADSMFNKDKTLANTYVKMGLKIARKYKLKLPRDIKRRYCKHCHSFLRIGVNCRVRIGEKNIIYSCLECRNFMRFPHKKPSRTAEMPK